MTGMPRCFASAQSTTLYPVARTAIARILGQASKVFLLIGVLLVMTISASPILSAMASDSS